MQLPRPPPRPVAFHLALPPQSHSRLDAVEQHRALDAPVERGSSAIRLECPDQNSRVPGRHLPAVARGHNNRLTARLPAHELLLPYGDRRCCGDKVIHTRAHPPSGNVLPVDTDVTPSLPPIDAQALPSLASVSPKPPPRLESAVNMGRPTPAMRVGQIVARPSTISVLRGRRRVWPHRRSPARRFAARMEQSFAPPHRLQRCECRVQPGWGQPSHAHDRGRGDLRIGSIDT